MESHGAVDKVNISHATYELLKSSNKPALSQSKGGGVESDEFIFESRGKLEVKGKGEMEVRFAGLR